ncbi:MAG: hypothetical protein ACOVQ4_04095 [Flectobacillus sp.]|uniref:hypothetical protein n=1 Tax=Flectobacillus sp. TaxID=50419 RepID=UPI003B99FE04
MNLDVNTSCVYDVIRLHDSNMLLPSQKDVAASIIRKKVKALKKEANDIANPEEKEWMENYIDYLEYKQARIQTNEPRFQYQ